MEEICCAECGDGLGLWFPKGKYDRNVYCEDCREVDDSTCQEEKDELENRVEELESENAALEAKLDRVESELQEAEIREADLEREREDPVEA